MTIQVPAYQRAWFSFVALTLVGVELAMLIVFSALNVDWSHPHSSKTAGILLQVATVAFAGTAFGAAQWIWFRTRVHKAGWWIIVTIISWYCSLLLFAVANWAFGDRYLDTDKMSATLAMLLPAVFLGTIPQWLLLRRNFSRAGMWILARGVGWAAGIGLLELANWLHIFQIGFLFGPDRVFGKYVPQIMAIAVAVAMFGFGFAAVTGVAAVWIQNHPISTGHRPSLNRGTSEEFQAR